MRENERETNRKTESEKGRRVQSATRTVICTALRLKTENLFNACEIHPDF